MKVGNVVGLVGWRGMVGSVLMDRMQAEGDFDLIEPIFFSTSNAGGKAPAMAKNEKKLKDAQDNLAANSGSLGSAFKNLGAAIVQPVSGAFGRVKNAATSAFSGIATKARDGMSAAGAAMQSTASRLTAPLSAKFSSMSSAIAARIPAPFKNVSNAIGGYLGNVGGANPLAPVQNVIDQVTGTLGSGIHRLDDAADAVGQGAIPIENQ